MIGIVLKIIGKDAMNAVGTVTGRVALPPVVSMPFA